MAEIAKTFMKVVLITFMIEAVGALLIFLSLNQVNFATIEKRIHISVFHAISAFCNAGFALHDDNLVQFQYDPIVNGVICALIILGGIGFPVLLDVYNRFHWSRPFDWQELHIHSKITLIATAVLIVGGFVLLLAIEWDNAIEQSPWYGKLMIAFFQSVTCRTAGFNTVDLNDLTGSH